MHEIFCLKFFLFLIKLRSFFLKNFKDDSAIQKFQDATKPQIPLLVLGNYSAGKSTFINSLVGYELLPASDHPTTAKVIQIEKCSENWIEISVNHLSHNICIRIEDGHFKVRADRIDEILVKKLEAISQNYLKFLRSY